jgi:hypothetical protein
VLLDGRLQAAQAGAGGDKQPKICFDAKSKPGPVQPLAMEIAKRHVLIACASVPGFNEKLIDRVKGNIRGASRSPHAVSLYEKVEDFGRVFRKGACSRSLNICRRTGRNRMYSHLTV